MLHTDSRIPVHFGALSDAEPGIALLIEGDTPAPPGAAYARFMVRSPFGHTTGCTCCAPRGPAAEALTRLFLAGVRGVAGPFRGVVAVASSKAGRRAVRVALDADPLSAARFRLD